MFVFFLLERFLGLNDFGVCHISLVLSQRSVTGRKLMLLPFYASGDITTCSHKTVTGPKYSRTFFQLNGLLPKIFLPSSGSTNFFSAQK